VAVILRSSVIKYGEEVAISQSRFTCKKAVKMDVVMEGLD